MEMVRHKRGDVREDGMVFWGYHKECAGGENWISANKFSEQRAVASDRNAKRYEAHREAIRKQQAVYYENNKGAILEQQAAYYKSNREDIRSKQRTYDARRMSERPEEVRSYKDAWQKARVAKDPLFALIRRVRRRISHALADAGYTKRSKTFNIVGCSVEELKAHIENKFEDGMNWNNRSEWHIDHIVPLASAKTEEELLSLCHYLNLQPLWASDNLRKGCKMPE